MDILGEMPHNGLGCDYKRNYNMAKRLHFIFQQDVQSIFDSFTELFGIRIAFFSPQGQELEVGENKPICLFCKLLREKLSYEHTCLALDAQMRQRCLRERDLITYPCHGGMTEAVTPVFAEDEHIGYIMIGQFRAGNRSISTTLRDQWKNQYHNDHLEHAFAQVPAFSPDHIDHILRLFTVLVDFIVSQRMIQSRHSDSLQPLLNYMAENVHQSLSLSDAADLVYRSPSALAHQFKQNTGKTFKRFQTDLKLKKADEFLTRHPHMTIREVAHKLGYDDPLYFSRLYKKHRGHSPSSLRKTNA